MNKHCKKIRCIESIPQGFYCYDAEGLCPYWSIRKDKPEQENGYCHFLKKGDWESEYCSLIWDRVKECDMFTDENEFNLSFGHIYTEAMKKFCKKISLWHTIPKCHGFLEKLINFVIKGKICRCKFCKKYFLTTKDAANETSCYGCWLSKMKRSYRKKRSKADE